MTENAELSLIGHWYVVYMSFGFGCSFLNPEKLIIKCEM
jgi:hypothetical protein